MENTNRDTAQDAAPQDNWWNAEKNELLYAANNVDPDPEDEEDEDEEDEENEDDGDWGHIDPAEGNSPFPDSNEPTAPGSAV